MSDCSDHHRAATTTATAAATTATAIHRPSQGNETSTPQDEPAPSPQPETPPFQYASYSKEKPEEGGKKSSSLPQKARAVIAVTTNHSFVPVPGDFG